MLADPPATGAATSYCPVGIAHSIAGGSAWEQTPWLAGAAVYGHPRTRYAPGGT
jgi:hypothetical protein